MFELNASQLVDFVFKVFNNREQWQKQGDVKQNAIFLVAALESSNLPGGSVVKNPPINVGDARDADLIPGLGKSPGEEDGNPLQYSCLENSMGKGA